MEPACDFCGVLRAVVYCKSDMARLCIPCDGCVHSANALSRRHARSLLCDKCSSQPAIIWCVDDKMSMCQACEWSNGDSGGCSSLGHRCQILDTYTGCAFLGELPRIFPSVLLDSNNNCSSNSVSTTSLGQLSSLSLNENCGSNSLEQRDNEGSIGLVTSKLNNELEPWMGNSPPIPPNPDSYIPNCSSDQAQLDPPFFSEDSNDPKVQGCSNFKEIELPDDDDLCGLNIEDVQLNIEESEEIFGCSQGQSRYRFEELGDDPLFMDKNLSVATQSEGPIENALEIQVACDESPHIAEKYEATSSGQHDYIAFQSSCVVGGTVNMAINCGAVSSMLTNPSFNDRNINLGFPPAAQVNSSMAISLSNITGESSAADYQDCGVSPMFLPGEAPWESSLEASSPQARDKAKMRYNEKKKTRTFGKQIRYASRKARADTRKRVKGRFVKAGDAYDYDPLGQE